MADILPPMNKEQKSILLQMDRDMKELILKNLRYRKGRLVCKHDKNKICEGCIEGISEDVSRIWGCEKGEEMRKELGGTKTI